MNKFIHVFLVSISYVSFRRILNIIKLTVSYWLSGSKEFGFKTQSPWFISIEPANFCQLHCPECPVGQSSGNKHTHNFINNLIVKKLIEELKSTLMHVIFYFQGEPLLNKELPEMIRYVHDSNIYTSVSTNAQLLSSEISKKLVLSGLDKLIVSVDGTSQEVYEKYRVGGSLEKTLQGIRHVVEWKKKLRSVTPVIEIQFLVLSINQHQMPDMKRLKKELGADKLTFKTAQLYDFENGNELLTTKKKYARYEKRKDGKYHIKSSQANRCWRLWSGAVINTSGEVLPCCFDKNSDFSFGNITGKSFEECWHSKEASGFRNKILQNRKQFEMCRNCTG